jgi:hypothetical protein
MKRLLIALTMVFAVAMLSLPVCALGSCTSCIQQCHDEGVTLYLNCLSNTTKPERQCYDEWQQYEGICASIFCPGCPISH